MKFLLFLACLPLVAQVQVVIQPDPMAIAQARLHSGKLPLGLWRVMIWNATAAPVAIAREQIEMQAPEVRFLSRDVALPILISRSGGKWKAAAHYLLIAGMLAPGGLGAVTISTRALKWIGAGMAGVEILRKDLESQTPDISALAIELPATITIPPGAGVTLEAWAAKMKAPKVYRFELPYAGASR